MQRTKRYGRECAKNDTRLLRQKPGLVVKEKEEESKAVTRLPKALFLESD